MKDSLRGSFTSSLGRQLVIFFFFSVGLITRQAEFKECDVTTFTCSTAHPGQQNPAEHPCVLLSASQHAPQASITPEHHPVFMLCRQQEHRDGAEVQVEVCSSFIAPCFWYAGCRRLDRWGLPTLQPFPALCSWHPRGTGSCL